MPDYLHKHYLTLGSHLLPGMLIILIIITLIILLLGSTAECDSINYNNIMVCTYVVCHTRAPC